MFTSTMNDNNIPAVINKKILSVFHYRGGQAPNLSVAANDVELPYLGFQGIWVYTGATY